MDLQRIMDNNLQTATPTGTYYCSQLWLVCVAFKFLEFRSGVAFSYGEGPYPVRFLAAWFGIDGSSRANIGYWLGESNEQWMSNLEGRTGPL